MPPPSQITSLTPEQELKVQEYYDKFFKQATCTDPADRPKAEKAALRLVEIGGVKIDKIEWVAKPIGATVFYNFLNAGFRNKLNDTLRDVLWNKLSDALNVALWDTNWLAFYIFGRDGIEYDEILKLYGELNESCFALSVLLEAIILCERPRKCEIVNGKLVGIEWRDSNDLLINEMNSLGKKPLTLWDYVQKESEF